MHKLILPTLNAALLHANATTAASKPAATHWFPPIVFISINCTSILQPWDVCCGQRVLTAHVFDPPTIDPGDIPHA